MAKIWRNQIIDGKKTFDRVPWTWQREVKALLREDVRNDVITASEYEDIVGEPYFE